MSNVYVSKAPYIANVTATLANTEYSYAIPSKTNKLTFKLRSQATPLKYSWTSGESGTTYMTLPPNASETLDGILLKNIKTIYFQTAETNQVLEIQGFRS